MTAPVSNRSALSALAVLRSVSSETDRVQLRISSGLRIGAAEDGASYWSIATTMRSTQGLVSTIRDGLGLAIGIVDTALSLADPVMEQLDGITTDLVQAVNDIESYRADTPDLRKLDSDLRLRIRAIREMIVSSGFNGVNLLYTANGAPTTLDIPSAIDTTSGTLQTVKMQVDLKQTTLIDANPGMSNFGIMSRWRIDPLGYTTGRSFFNTPGFGPLGTPMALYPGGGITGAVTANEFRGQGKIFAEMAEDTRNAFATLGALKMRLELQLEQANLQLGVMDKSVGVLVDADMNDESTRLKALEAQRQLAIQSLSLINQQSNNVLLLFKA